MRQRGRKSGAALAVAPVDDEPFRLKSPASLSDAERVIFVALVTTCDARHFRPSDLPLLVRHVEACALADLAGVDAPPASEPITGSARCDSELGINPTIFYLRYRSPRAGSHFGSD
jgi:hypothetical protein